MNYAVPLIWTNENRVDVLAIALDRSTASPMRVKEKAAFQMFNLKKRLISYPVGEVDLPLGIHHAEISSIIQAIIGNPQLLRSLSGSEFLIDNIHPGIKLIDKEMNKGVYYIVGVGSNSSLLED